MSILKALFWIALVAVMMPQGPSLGIDFSHLRHDLSARQNIHPADFQAVATAANSALRWQVVKMQSVRPEPDLAETVQSAVLTRLDTVRTELAAARQAGAVPSLRD